MSNSNENLQETLSRIEGKIDQLESDVKKISHHANPSWWKKFTGFIVNNFFTFLTLVSLFLISWKSWNFYQEEIVVQLEALKNIVETLKNIPNSLGDIPDSFRNVQDSVKGVSDSLQEVPKNAENSLEAMKELLNSVKF